ncbi:unnamed protein product, partial [Rotaria sordida]
KAQNISNTTARNTSSNSSTSSARTLRRLQSNSKTVQWANFNDNYNSNDSNGRNETSNYQQQTLQIDEVSMSSDESNNGMTPSTIINSLHLSHSNNSNNNNDTTAALNSPKISDADENVDRLTTNVQITMLDSKVQQNAMKLAELLTFFDECDGGTAYICKLCQT